jgi:hypothetical protein
LDVDNSILLENKLSILQFSQFWVYLLSTNIAELSANLRGIQAAGCLQRRYSIYLNEAGPLHRSYNIKNLHRERIMGFGTGQSADCEKPMWLRLKQSPLSEATIFYLPNQQSSSRGDLIPSSTKLLPPPSFEAYTLSKLDPSRQ